MAEYLSCTVKELITNIENGKYVLPAMQRNFVWPETKIYGLFDSLMRDFPIGTCLFWDIDKNTFGKYVFNDFIKVVDEAKQKDQRGERSTAELSEYSAVLDGQQRITSLYIGAAGKWRTHIKGRKYDDETSYYDRYLCIDILSVPKNDEEKYPFCFIEEHCIGKVLDTPDGKKSYWLKISDVMKSDFKYVQFVMDFDREFPGILNQWQELITMLEKLNDALKKTKTINYYPSKDKSLPEIVEIFVRVNSGGQKLAASDLMLSVASGNQDNPDHDVHSDMKQAIIYINSSAKNDDSGFKVDQELILTAGLLFTGANSLSLQKMENYSRASMNNIFGAWDKIIDALANTVRCIEYIGFSGKKLSSKSLILPIAYYYYKHGLQASHISGNSVRSKCDRIFIRQWMLRAMINDVFMDGTGGTLVHIRRVIDASEGKYFPLDDLIIAGVKQPLAISKKLDEICELSYGDVKVLPILMELARYAQVGEYQVDHIWAKELMKKTSIKKIFPTATDDDIKFFTDNCQNLPNLELLRSQDNMSKSDEQYDIWVKREQLKDHYYDENCIPTNISYEFKNFEQFYKKRTELIRTRLGEVFPDNFADIVKKYGLNIKTK